MNDVPDTRQESTAVTRRRLLGSAATVGALAERGPRLAGVKETNITEWRRRTVGDLTSAFRFHDAKRYSPSLPGTNGQYNPARYEASNFPLPVAPTTDQYMPKQEPGHRPQVP